MGITPGLTQTINALNEAKKQLNIGADNMTALIAAKKTGAFSGTMRKNLVDMLDHVNVNKWLGIKSCNSLFNEHNNLVHTTSLLRYPVFIDSKNYNGTPNMTKHPLLIKYLKNYFISEIKGFKDAIIIPLGSEVSKAINFLNEAGEIDGSRVLHGIPHPSPASSERISYFLGKKDKSKLSIKTNPVILDNAKANFIKKLNNF